MASLTDLRDKAQELASDSVLWAITFTGICILVGLGKLKPETVEYMMFALLGKAASSGSGKASSPPKE